MIYVCFLAAAIVIAAAILGGSKIIVALIDLASTMFTVGILK